MSTVYCHLRTTGGGYKKAGDKITVQCDLKDAAGNSTTVNITGNPYIKLSVIPFATGVPGVNAAMTGTPVTGCSSIGLEYTIQTSDQTVGKAPVDIYGTPQITLGGGSITQAGQPVTLTVAPVSGSTTDFLDGPEFYVEDIAPVFYLVSCDKAALTTGGTLRAVFTSSQIITGTVSASIAGVRAVTPVSSDGATWTFDYTVVGADSEGALPAVVSGPNLAGVVGTTGITLPCVVDRTPPATPTKPTRESILNSNGTVAFSWAPVVDTGSGVKEYNAKIVKDGAAEVFSGSVGLTLTASLSGAVAAAQYACLVQAVDKVGNASAWSPASDLVTIDYTVAKPYIELVGDPPHNSPEITVDVYFRDAVNYNDLVAVTGFTRSYVKVTNAAMGDIEALSAARYRITLYPTAVGTVTLRVLSGSAVAENGTEALASDLFTFAFDNIRPSCRITGPTKATCTAPVPFAITFSKPVTSLTTDDINATGGTCSEVTGAGTKWTAKITPAAMARPTDITCEVPAEVTTDANDNPNLASNIATAVFDDSVPTISSLDGTDVAGTYYGIGDTIRIAVTFTKAVRVNAAGGNPTLGLVLGAQSRSAAFQSGNGSDVLIFSYAVKAGDPTCTLDHSTLSLNGGTIKDYAGNNATLTLGSQMLAASDLRIDTTRAPYANTFAGINDDIATAATTSSVPVSSTTLTKAMRSGIGDKDHLLAQIVTDSHEQWMPRLKPGWFYYKEREHYLFSKKLTKSTTNYSVGTAVTLTNTDPNYDTTKITQYGPVFVKGSGSGVSMPYTQVSSPLRALATLTGPTQIPNTNNYSYTVPGIPVELVRTTTSQPMRRVPSVEAIQDSNEYYQYVSMVEDSLVYTVVVADAAAVYATYVPIGDADLFVQHEVCAVGSKMQIRAMYKNVITTKAGKNPVVIAIDNGIRVTIPAEGLCSGNVITLPVSYDYTRPDGSPATLILEPGDKVGLVYYVDRSYVIDQNKVYAYSIAAATIDTLTVEYEGATEAQWDGTKILAGSGSYVQLNPLKDGVSPGFLYLVDESTQDLTPAALNLAASPGAVTVNPTTGSAQPVRVRVRLTDRAGDPVRGASVVLSSHGIVTLTKAASNTATLPNVTQTVGGTAVSIDGVGRYVGAVFTLYPQASYSASWVNGTGWVLTWSAPPPQGQSYYVLYSPAMGTYSSFYPASKLTDWCGEVRAVWTPTTPANTIIVASLVGGLLGREVGVSQVDYAALATTAFDNAALTKKAYLTVTSESREPGTVKVRAYVADITGSYPIRGAAVSFFSAASRFSDTAPVVTNDDGVAENTYYLSGADTIYASAAGLFSNRITMSGATS